MSAADTNNTTGKRHVEGVVVRRSGDKTVAVETVRALRHPVYKKTMKSTKRYLAHDPNNTASVGDRVVIQESRPLSRRKRWVVVTSDKKNTQ
jgi:small subunit ribosomal protein S17